MSFNDLGEMEDELHFFSVILDCQQRPVSVKCRHLHVLPGLDRLDQKDKINSLIREYGQQMVDILWGIQQIRRRMSVFV